MKDFPYGDLLKKSWTWTLKNKILWILGLFVSGGGSLYQLGDSSWLQNDSFTSMLDGNSEALIIGVVFVLILVALFLFFAIVGFVAKAGLLLGIKELQAGKSYKFWPLVKMGAKKFPRLLLVNIFIWGVSIIPIVIIALLGAYAAGAFSLIVSGIVVLLLMVYVAVISLFKHYIDCYAVLDDYTAWKAIKAGLEMLKKNFVVLLLTKLITIGLGIAVAMATGLAVFLVAIPFILLAILLAIPLGAAGGVVGGIVGGIVVIAAVVIIRGGSGMYFNSFLTQVYWKLK